ncbi:MAG: site-specific integrase [Clostridia bacterium]|nr:site-specific integrase [Clostridia bacterium]
MKGSLQIKSGTYYVVYREDGKQKWHNLHITADRGHKREANTAMQKFLYECEHGQSETVEAPPLEIPTPIVEIPAPQPVEAKDEDILFTDFLSQWVEEIKPTVKPVTYETYKTVVDGRLIPYFKDKHYYLKDLKGKIFTEYFVYLKEHGRMKGKGGLKKKVVLNVRGVISSALKYAVENDLMKSNVIEHSRLPIFDDEQTERVIYTPQQLKTLLTCAEQTNSSATLFLNLVITTGARRGELLGLTWENVDFDNNTIYICQNLTGNTKVALAAPSTPKTVNGYRTVSLPPKVMDMLKNEKAHQEENKQLLKDQYKTYDYDFVIRQADGSIYHPNSINRIIRGLIDEAGLPQCRIHDFRHAVASILFDNGVPLADVTTQLGHGQTSTTEKIYIHKSNVAKTENMSVLSSVIGL